MYYDRLEVNAISTQQKLFWKSFFLTLLSLLTIIALTFLIFFENSPFKKNNSVNNTVQVPKLAPITTLYCLKSEQENVPDFFSLVTIKNDGTIITVSFPKNTTVYLNKATSSLALSYGNGGGSKAKECLSETYSIPIDYYADLTFQEFGDLLSALGKIEYKVFENIEVKDKEQKVIFKLQSGLQTLNGTQIAGLINHCSLSYKEKVILLDDLLKIFLEENCTKDNTQELSEKLDRFFNQKNTDFSTTGTQKLEQLFTNFPFENKKVIHPIVSGVTQENLFYLDDGTLSTLNSIFRQ